VFFKNSFPRMPCSVQCPTQGLSVLAIRGKSLLVSVALVQVAKPTFPAAHAEARTHVTLIIAICIRLVQT
jgi:hypothetical protein